MSITKTLSNKDLDPAAKLEAVAETVAKARSAYGNEDAEIAAPMVSTVHGDMNFNHLEDDSKVEILKAEVQRIKARAVEYSNQNPGTSLNRKIEELIALNPLFVNISAGTKFEYI